MEYRKAYNGNINEEDIRRICAGFSVAPQVAEFLLAKGFKDDKQIHEFLNPSEKHFHDPFLLKNMHEAVDRINKAVKNNERINIFGDYDADGITATAVLIDYFKGIGAAVSHFLPNRYTDGYGLTLEAIDRVITDFNPGLIITVDCGISSHAEAEYIKSKGLDVIITDHHDIPEKLPDCLILNAKLGGQRYPFNELCGAGMAFKLVHALAGIETAKKYLPIVAIATVSDIVPLLDENRAIVALGLKDSAKALPIGLRLLADSLNLKGALTASDISFKLAPKINASGRMGNAEHSLKLYTETNKTKLLEIIAQLQEYNTERQNLCNIVHTECVKALNNQNMANLQAIILTGENWNIGILGIVAARIAEEFNRPTFLLGRDGNEYRGSSRSIPNMNIHELLTKLSDCLESFGGHPMAAGLTIHESRIEEFKTRANALISTTYPDEVYVPFRNYDIEIDCNKISADYIEAFSLLEPFGFSNPKPVFKVSFGKCTVSTMKNYPAHLTVQLPNIMMIGFNMGGYFNMISQNSFKDALLELQVNYYRGQGAPKAIIQDIKISDVPNVTSERIGGEYIKQLALAAGGKKPVYGYYNKHELAQIVNKEQRNSLYGTLFLANTMQSYKAFLENNPFAKNIICFEFLHFTNNSGYNTLCLCPSLNNFYKNFNRIVLLDSVLDEAYIVKLNEVSDAEILIPQSSPFVYAPFKNIDLNRKVFGEYFNLLKQAGKANLTAIDEYNYFNKLKKTRKSINYVQFVACLYTFTELGLVKVADTFGEYKVSVVSGVTAKLENSRFYAKLELIMKMY
ncbi:MAG: single-stranded-DNA-specific exonuclease RecJ [Firmicutes bacterium]|nr:single-stranded-DNA-specific exonuclease RecJ [Bacillota bacterium]